MIASAMADDVAGRRTWRGKLLRVRVKDAHEHCARSVAVRGVRAMYSNSSRPNESLKQERMCVRSCELWQLLAQREPSRVSRSDHIHGKPKASTMRIQVKLIHSQGKLKANSIQKESLRRTQDKSTGQVHKVQRQTQDTNSCMQVLKLRLSCLVCRTTERTS